MRREAGRRCSVRRGWRSTAAATVALVLLATGLGVVGDARVVPETEVVWRDGDYVILGARGTAGTAPAVGGGGYTTYGNATLRDRYTVRLVDSRGIETVRPHVADAVETIDATIAQEIELAPGVVGEMGTRTGRIDLVVSDRAPCASPWLGCGAPLIDDGQVKAAKVWIHPRLLERSAAEIDNTVRHELGHAFGLGHYNATHGGRIQTMHATSPAAPRYEAGDLSGLIAVSGKPGKGEAPSTDPGPDPEPSPTPPGPEPPSPAPAPESGSTPPRPAIVGDDPVGSLYEVISSSLGVVIRGRAEDPDANKPITVVVTMDGHPFEIVAGGHDERVGDNRSFEVVWPVPPGLHELCVQARNVGPGVDVTMGCQSVTVSDSGIGRLGLRTF